MKDKQTIYFNQKIFHRERQADTVKYAAKFFKVISPLKKEVDNLKTFNEVPLYMKIITWLVTKIPIINIRKMNNISKKADYIYTRWDIPLFPQKPFIIELDNPYVLTFYNYFAFKLFKPIIKRFLQSKKCMKIVCISEACKKVFLDEMGRKFEHKTTVLYPRMRDFEQKKINKNDTIKFIFIGLDPLRKGCYELLEAFSQVKNDGISLDIIWFKNSFLQEKYKHDKRISFLWQIKRQIIFDKHLPEGNIFILPTYHESFGIVVLESLSRGLGVITTNVFALPEMCRNGYNGKIIKHPYLKENKYWFVDITKMTITNFNKKFLENKKPNEKMIKELKMAIKEWIKNYKTWQKNSKNLYDNIFSKRAWEKSFLDIFKQ